MGSKSEVQIGLEMIQDSDRSAFDSRLGASELTSRLNRRRIEAQGLKDSQHDAYIQSLSARVANLESENTLLRGLLAERAEKRSALAEPDATAAPGAYDQTQMQGVVDLLNEVKAKLDVMNS